MIKSPNLVRVERIDDLILFMHHDPRPHVHVMWTEAEREGKCPQCGGNHTLAQCPRWRIDKIREQEREQRRDEGGRAP